MFVTPTVSITKGVPDYYKIYAMWIKKYDETGDSRCKAMASHYAHVAEEFGQAIIDDSDESTDRMCL
jgi:hypothetical protein